MVGIATLITKVVASDNEKIPVGGGIDIVIELFEGNSLEVGMQMDYEGAKLEIQEIVPGNIHHPEDPPLVA